MTARLRFGILGAGRIAGAFAAGVKSSSQCDVVAIGSSSIEKADAFARDHCIERAYGSYEQLVDDAGVDAVYVATPNGVHKDNVMMSLQRGKHMLCEKPMATSSEDAQLMFAEAHRRSLVLLEGFPFRFQPQTQEVLRRLKAGDFGELRTASAGFGFNLTRTEDPRWDPSLGGGSLWDVGVYPINLARAVFGQQPHQVLSSVRWAETGVDRSANAVLHYADDRAANVWCSFETASFRRAHLVCSKAVVDFSYTNSSDGPDASAYFVKLDGWNHPFERVEAPFGNGFLLEAEGFAAAVNGGPNLGTTPEETIDNIKTIEASLSGARKEVTRP